MSENIDDLQGLETPEVPETTEQVEAPAAEPETKVHPAHEKLLAELPEAWHSKVTPHLQEQDKFYQLQMEKFSGYKKFVEDGVDPEYINQSIQLAKAISEDPLAIHKNLTDALMAQGLIKAEAQAQAKEMMDEAEGIYEEADLTPAMKRELEKRDAEMAKIQDQLSAQEQEKATQAELESINREFESLTSQYDVSPAQEKAIVQLMEAALASGKDMTVIDAARQLVEITGAGFKRKGTTDLAAAPTVVGGAGGNGVPFEAVTVPKDDKGKRDMLAQMFKNALQN